MSAYIHIRWRDPKRDNWRWSSLKHADRDRAVVQATETSSQLRDGRTPAGSALDAPRQGGRHLYFLLNEVTGLLKIGIADHVAKRQETLERAGGVPLRLLRVVEDGCDQERPLHKRFAHLRRLGEWFEATPELIAVAVGPA